MKAFPSRAKNATQVVVAVLLNPARVQESLAVRSPASPQSMTAMFGNHHAEFEATHADTCKYSTESSLKAFSYIIVQSGLLCLQQIRS